MQPSYVKAMLRLFYVKPMLRQTATLLLTKQIFSDLWDKFYLREYTIGTKLLQIYDIGVQQMQLILLLLASIQSERQSFFFVNIIVIYAQWGLPDMDWWNAESVGNKPVGLAEFVWKRPDTVSLNSLGCWKRLDVNVFQSLSRHIPNFARSFSYVLGLL